MNQVSTPDGYGTVLRTETARGRTSYLVKGAMFEGWYDALQVTSADGSWDETLVPGDLDEDNETTLPYPSRPQGPGWDGSNSTISLPNDTDLHFDKYGPSDSLTGEPTGDDPVEADIEGLFEPHSKLSGRAPRRLHFANGNDPILEVSKLPEESPSDTGADTDELFDDTPSHIASATYDRLVIEDDLSFLRLAADDDDDKKDRRDDDSDDDDHDRDDDDSKDSDSDSDDDDDSPFDDGDHRDRDGDDDSDDDGDRDGGRTASFALTTTADLHFLANLCTDASCDESIPLHSKSEHREGGLKQKRRKNQPLGNKPLKGEHNPKAAINTPKDAGYSSDTKGVGRTVKKNPPKRQDHGEWGVKKLEPIHSDFSDGHSKKRPPINGVTPQEYDLDKELEQAMDDEYQQWTHQESNLPNLVDHDLDNGDSGDGYRRKLAADDDSEKETEFVKRGGDGWVLLQHGDNPKTGKKDGDVIFTAASRAAVIKHLDAIEYAKHGSAKTAAPAAPPQPTQIESQIEQLMQFWAVDNNGWWHWTGSQGDLALLNQMQQQMAVVGMPQGQPGAMQAQSAVTGFELEPHTPAHWRSYLQTIASDRLVALAAWKDVVEKSKRLRAEGAIHVETFRPDVITALVQGDNGQYYTTVQRLGSVQGLGRQNLTSGQVSGWSCDCEWGQWAWLRKRSFVGRMCSHAYALFTEMRSMDAKERKAKGKPGRFASVAKTAWTRTASGGFEWVSADVLAPTAAIAHTAAGWTASVWSDGTAEDSLDLGTFRNSGHAQRAASRILTAHFKLADDTVDLVGGDSPYTEVGDKDPSGEEAHIQESTDDENTPKYSSFSLWAADDGKEDEGDEKTDDGQDDEDDPRDDESLDEEIAEDEDDSDDGKDEDGGEEPKDDDGEGDGGHWEKHRRDDDDDEGTDNPGDDSDDHHVEKHSSVGELQQQYGLTHLAGKDYDMREQADLVGEGKGKFARNLGDVNDADSMYAGKKMGSDSAAEDVLAFLF